MKNTISILKSVKNDTDKYSIILQLSHFISTLLPLITSSITDAYKSMLRDKRAMKIAEAEKKQMSIETSTSSIAEALSNEKSMPSTHMDNILEKKVEKKLNKRLAKNLKGCKQVTFSKSLHPSNQSSTSPLNRKKKSSPSNQKKKGSPYNQKKKRSPNHHHSNNVRDNQKRRSYSSPKHQPMNGKKRKWNKWNRSSEEKGKGNANQEE